jgi:hypothetical protein
MLVSRHLVENHLTDSHLADVMLTDTVFRSTRTLVDIYALTDHFVGQSPPFL